MGTELRQLRIYDRELSNPFEMEKMLTDNVARRHFVIDADVQVQKEKKRGRERERERKVEEGARGPGGTRKF